MPFFGANIGGGALPRGVEQVNFGLGGMIFSTIAGERHWLFS